MDADLALWEKARRELYKNAKSYIEPISKATYNKTVDVRPPTSDL